MSDWKNIRNWSKPEMMKRVARFIVSSILRLSCAAAGWAIAASASAANSPARAF